jgi:hypothetical protein
LNEEGDKIKASCSRIDARRATDYLYNGEIKISLWKIEKQGQKTVYEMCDVYRNKDIFDDLFTFVQLLREKDEIESLMEIHKKIKYLLQNGAIKTVARIMKLYNHKSTDINVLKTILLITKSFKDSSEFGDLWYALSEKYHTQYNNL